MAVMNGMYVKDIASRAKGVMDKNELIYKRNREMSRKTFDKPNTLAGTLTYADEFIGWSQKSAKNELNDHLREAFGALDSHKSKKKSPQADISKEVREVALVLLRMKDECMLDEVNSGIEELRSRKGRNPDLITKTINEINDILTNFLDGSLNHVAISVAYYGDIKLANEIRKLIVDPSLRERCTDRILKSVELFIGINRINILSDVMDGVKQLIDKK